MKKNYTTLFLMMLTNVLFAQSDTLSVNEKSTLHLQCASKIIYCDLGSSVINAAVAPGVPNLLRIKATGYFDGVTNLSVLTEDDQFKTYVVKYVENLRTFIIRQKENTKPSRYNDTLRKIHQQQPILNHIFDRILKIDFNINSIYIANDKVYITLSIKNRSAINYSADATFTISDIRRNRNTAQDIVLVPLQRYGLLEAPAQKEAVVTYVFDRLAIASNKEILVNIYEIDGYRNIALHIDSKDIANAKIYR